MPKRILLTLLITTLTLAGATNIASAINLGHTVFDNEIPETVSDDTFDAENPGINFGLCAGFSNIPDEDCNLTAEQIQEITEFEPAEEIQQTLQDIQIAAPIIQTPPPTPIYTEPETVVVEKTVYVETPVDEQRITEIIEEISASDEAKVLGVTNSRSDSESLLSDLSAKITDIEKQIEKTGTTLQDIILVLLVIALSVITIRTELRFQTLAAKHSKLKKQLTLTKWVQQTLKKTKKPKK